MYFQPCHSQHGHKFFYVLKCLIKFLVFSIQQSILVLQEVYYTLLYFEQPPSPHISIKEFGSN